MATEILHMAQYLKRKGPIQDKETFVSSAKDIVNSTKSISQFLKAIADHCLDKHCADDLAFIVEQMQTVSSQLTIISNVNALTPGSKSSDESLVKNAQNLLRIVLQGLHAAEAACIRGLRQPEPNSDGAKAAALCFQWKKNLLIHRALQISNPETDDLGLRKTASRPAAPSLAASVHLMEGYK
ncbi:catenin alpha-1 [Denticeps clupeoides]|uniref:catenin alpha-1 n=1 Tax=Denticeps clupeoides TaxID=299321 RepID=UPI0010A4E5F9|nr:catenin alpha-1-like [Denticeps clupeoides]XP_028844430.1 catenin alpha-1-like [Denticeps clupeoides]